MTPTANTGLAREQPCRPCRRRAALLRALADSRWAAGAPSSALLALTAVGEERLARAARAQRLAPALAALQPRASSATPAGAHKVLCPHCAAYPAALAALPCAPGLLFLRGTGAVRRAALSAPAVAIVGTRATSADGAELAQRLAYGLARTGVTVVAELERGVGALALEAGLAAGGAPLALAAAGPDRAAPAGLAALHETLAARAVVAGELPWDAAPSRWAAIARTRLLAGLCSLLIVVEAAGRSSALLAAAVARDAGRDVGAVPGRALSPACRGSNQLLRDGAHVVSDVEEVLDLLHGVGRRPRARGGAGAARQHVVAARARPPPAARGGPARSTGVACRLVSLEPLSRRPARPRGRRGPVRVAAPAVTAIAAATGRAEGVRERGG